MKLGIDIGTHVARSAYLDKKGQPQLITLPDGNANFPAIVRQTMHSLEVGPGVVRSLAGNAETTVSGCTRLMGWAGAIPKQLVERLPYTVREVGGEAICNLLYAEVRASDIYAVLVNTLVQLAVQVTGQSVSEVVLTTPASAEDRFRVQARAAVESRGVKVKRLINQPAAALLATKLPTVRYVVVVNCGGGSTEVSIAKREGNISHVLATAGDMLLGGDDFAWAVARQLNERFRQSDGLDVFAVDDSHLAAMGLRVAAEDALQQLCHVPEITLALDHGGGFGRDLMTMVQQGEIATWLKPHLSRLEELCQQALTASLKADPQTPAANQIEAVVLIGDWVHLPAVSQTIAQFFQRPVSALYAQNSALLPVYGAALATAVKGQIIHDVTPYALGINCYYGEEELFSPIIKANTAIPTPPIGDKKAYTERYTTRYPDQTEVKLDVLQYRGEREADPYQKSKVYPHECEVLGTWEFKGLHPKPKEHAPFTVTFAIDDDGILHLYAKETGTGHHLSAMVTKG